MYVYVYDVRMTRLGWILAGTYTQCGKQRLSSRYCGRFPLIGNFDSRTFGLETFHCVASLIVCACMLEVLGSSFVSSKVEQGRWPLLLSEGTLLCGLEKLTQRSSILDRVQLGEREEEWPKLDCFYGEGRHCAVTGTSGESDPLKVGQKGLGWGQEGHTGSMQCYSCSCLPEVSRVWFSVAPDIFQHPCIHPAFCSIGHRRKVPKHCNFGTFFLH